MTQALTGLRVIDMTHNQAGPACAQMLGFLGADVIKLEEPKGGDIARAQNNDELFFLAFNANKRSLTLNLKADEAKAHFRKIIAQSDVRLRLLALNARKNSSSWFCARAMSPPFGSSSLITSAPRNPSICAQAGPA